MVLFGVAATVQTVRINGISVFGMYAVQGYKPLLDQADKDLGTYRANQATLQNGLNICNTSVENLGKLGDKVTKLTQQLVDMARQQAEGLRGNIAAIQSIKSSDEKCPVANSILERGFQ